MKKLCLVSAAWLIFFTVPYAHAQSMDTDSDGLTDEQETSIYYTNANEADTDGDSFSDGEEVTSGYSPLVGGKKRLVEVDTDKDGLNDDWELKLGTDLNNPDTDGDSFSDGIEVLTGHDPLSETPINLEKTIIVSLTKQTLTYSFGNTVLDEFPISSGLKRTPTPVGEFSVLQKRPTVHYKGVGFDFPNTKWNLRFKQGATLNYYIHGAYWHNKFGKPMSHGCVNVSYANMERLYNWAQVGTKVVIKAS